jgi:hypothetical protein
LIAETIIINDEVVVSSSSLPGFVLVAANFLKNSLLFFDLK